jgi:MFS family permease
MTSLNPSTPSTSLSRNPEFLKLWIGQTISVFGSQITGLALQLTAVLILNASSTQMGTLNALGILPFILVSLFAGVWADRVRRRPILIAADVGRAVLLGSIPVALLGGFLSIEYLYIVTFLIGVMTVFFDVSYQSFLPSLVGREHLVEGNSKLEITNSAAAIAGPGLAGLLVQAITAPLAIAFDALSYLISAISIAQIRSQETIPERSEAEKKSVWKDIGEGLRVVFGNRLLWSIAGSTATFNFFWGGILNGVYVLYLTRELNIPPAVQGFIFGAGAPGALVGALIARRVAARYGLGSAIIGAVFTAGLGGLLVILAVDFSVVSVAALVLTGFITSLCNVIYNVNQVSLRQAITPDRLLGRMNASMRFLVWGTIPIGAFMGGLLGESIGLRSTIIIGAVGSLAPFLWVYFSPVRRLKDVPAPAETDV